MKSSAVQKRTTAALWSQARVSSRWNTKDVTSVYSSWADFHTVGWGEMDGEMRPRSLCSSNNSCSALKDNHRTKTRIWKDNQPLLQAARLNVDQQKKQKSKIDISRVVLFFYLNPRTALRLSRSDSSCVALCLLVLHKAVLTRSILPLTAAEQPKSHWIASPASRSILLWAQAHIAPLILLWSITN